MYNITIVQVGANGISSITKLLEKSWTQYYHTTCTAVYMYFRVVGEMYELSPVE